MPKLVIAYFRLIALAIIPKTLKKMGTTVTKRIALPNMVLDLWNDRKRLKVILIVIQYIVVKVTYPMETFS